MGALLVRALALFAVIPLFAATVARAEGRRLALVVGTTEYAGPWARLPNAAPDADKLGELLERRFGFTVTRVLDKDRETFKRALSAQADAAGDEDDLLVFVAGHGYFDPTDKAGYLVFADADAGCDRGCYPLDHIKRALYGTRARHVLVMLDACHAGTFDPSIAFGGGTFGRRGEILPAHLRQILRDYGANRSRLVFASVGKAPTLDGTPGEAHSPFVRLLLGELERAVVAGAVSIDRIAIVMKEGPEPLPVLAPTSFPANLPHDVGATFLFVTAADLCDGVARLLVAARDADRAGIVGGPSDPAWGQVRALEPTIPGAERCLLQRFETDGRRVVRCRYGRYPEADVEEHRRALERRVGLCVAATDAGARVEASCDGGSCALSVRVDLPTEP